MKPSIKHCVLLAILACVIQMICSSYAWNEPLIDLHAFRQTQTAISSYYMVQEGITTDYQTPVLGKPWQIPMEFPSYQMVTAFITKVFHTPLDQTGRFVSLICFYFLIFVVVSMSRNWIKDQTCLWILTAILITSPFYMFWSRTFMIESMALLFSLSSAYFGFRFAEQGKSHALILAIILGILGGLTKVTTFFVTCVFFTSLILMFEWKSSNSKNIAQTCVKIGIILLPGLVAGALWNRHADAVKALNPLADMITSSQLKRFNFGTLDQRITFRTWDTYALHISNILTYPWKLKYFSHRIIYDQFFGMRFTLLVFTLIGSFWMMAEAFKSKSFKFPAIACALAFVSGPLVFTNLYVEHEYYSYANAMYLLLLVAFGGIELYQKHPRATVLFLAVMMIARFDAYTHTYKRFIDAGKEASYETVFDSLKKNTEASKAIMIFGERWSSLIPYYSQRKALMITSGVIHEPKFQQAVDLIGVDNISAVVLCPRFLDSKDVDLIQAFNTQMNFTRHEGPFEKNGCSLFYRN